MKAGQSTIDITPPLGIELAGFHKPVGEARRATSVRQPAALSALAIEAGGKAMALVSIDVCAVSMGFAQRVQQGVERACGIPAAHVRVTATHTHSMPSFYPLRQWGAVPEAYMQMVEEKAVEAVRQAVADLAEADLYVGRATVEGGNFNRTVNDWKTPEAFGPKAWEDDRWLDTDLHVLQFMRARDHGPIVWYHFSAHPVCYADEGAGPDWPGGVADRIEAVTGTRPVLLQGHIGDVNPGDGTPWRGDFDETVDAVSVALHHAASHAEWRPVDTLRVVPHRVRLPYDLDRLRADLAEYEANPEACDSGIWVDAGFAKAWYEAASTWQMSDAALTAPVTAVRLGSVGLLFHPGELYSYFGLRLRRESPFATTLCVGFTDGLVGYLPDQRAYAESEYAAVVVPKILDLPPFSSSVGIDFTTQCADLLKGLA